MKISLVSIFFIKIIVHSTYESFQTVNMFNKTAISIGINGNG